MSKKCWFHKWENIAESCDMHHRIYYKCIKCGIVKTEMTHAYARDKIIKYHSFPLDMHDIWQTTMCETCGSHNVYYCPQFSYDHKYKKDRIAGICECLDCGTTRSVC